MAGIMDGARQFHIQTTPEEVGRYVILCGDPARVAVIAAHLDSAAQVAQNREYTVYTGTLAGERVSVCSTGIGGPSAAIAVEELVKCGADTLIRVGTSGGMNMEVSGGDLVIAASAVRGEGTSFEYLTPDYPCAASFAVTAALKSAAEELSGCEPGMRFHIGTVHSKDSFYGEVEPEHSPVGEGIKARWDSYLKCGCLASEMECAAIYAAATTRGVRAGAVLTALWNVERTKAGLPDKVTHDSSRAIACAVRAVELLIAQDYQGKCTV
ncbi:MAG: nucleoside phosphorylase [Oscillospiraceae bacterium]